MIKKWMYDFFGIIPCLVNLKFIWQLSGWIVLDEDFECLWNIVPYVPTHPHISQTTELQAFLIVTYEALCDLSFSAFENAFLLPEMPFPNPLFANFIYLLVLDITCSAVSFQTSQDWLYAPLNVS